jgi:hypothetical protein
VLERRFLGAVAAVATTVAVLAAGSPADASPKSLRFASLPRSVFEGQKPTIAVTGAPRSGQCTLTLDYPGGRSDRWSAQLSGGNASWAVRIPAVPPGLARVAASCGSGAVARGSMWIRWAVQTPKITIAKRGYTQRPDSYGTGSTVGWGAIVRNDRRRSEAINISLLLNCVDATNRVLGSAFSGVARVPAASAAYVGGQIHLNTKTPVARLEIVVRGQAGPPQAGTPPLVSDLAMLPGPDGYVASLSGQILNNYRRPMQSAVVGAVIVDSRGNILGGSSTFAAGPLSYGARELFWMSSLNTIAMNRVASAHVSVVASFPPTR